MAKTIGGPANQSQSRPIILNRPFRSVAELGYVFSDTPWRNLDMFTPESGFAGLLDAFSVTDTGDSAGRVAGKVNLNTRQTSVLQAGLAGAYRDEINAAAATIPGSSATSLAGTIAGALVARTTSTTAGNGPIANISEIVGKWVGSNTAANGGIDGGASYSGFSTDLTSAITGAATSASPPYAAADKTNDQNIERFQEAAMRALSGSGQTRVWNLMIDIVAQTGRFPQSATVPDKFTVDGEQRCWIHVAIDRMTGQVIDKQMEVVKE